MASRLFEASLDVSSGRPRAVRLVGKLADRQARWSGVKIVSSPLSGGPAVMGLRICIRHITQEWLPTPGYAFVPRAEIAGDTLLLFFVSTDCMYRMYFLLLPVPGYGRRSEHDHDVYSSNSNTVSVYTHAHRVSTTVR